MRITGALSMLTLAAVTAIGCDMTGDVGGEPDEGRIEFQADNGIQITNGLNLTNGATLSNGVRLTNGVRLSNGVDADNGVRLTNGAVLDNGLTGPYYAPPAGSGLEQWIDADPGMHIRILRYLVECALPPGVPVQLLYRGQLQTLGYGVANLGPGLQQGEMSELERQAVTSCLLARTNAKGQLVHIDMFGPMAGFNDARPGDETYTLLEAAFFGDLFADQPAAFACSVGVAACELRACGPDGHGGCDCGVIQTAVICDDVNIDVGAGGGTTQMTAPTGSNPLPEETAIEPRPSGANGGVTCSWAPVPDGVHEYLEYCHFLRQAWSAPITTYLAP